MRIDCHVHSYPTFIPGQKNRYIPETSGIYKDRIGGILKEREENTGEMHGVFYGGHDARVLTDKPNNDYVLRRVLPMVESHPLQLIGVTSWDNLATLEKLRNAESQIEAIVLMAEEGGLAIIDQPREIYKEPPKDTNDVFLNHKGEATITELKSLSEDIKKRTFLCYSGMMPWIMPAGGVSFRRPRKNAEKVSELTGLKLLGGSDTILSESSLFSTYNSTPIEDIRDVFETPELFGELHKGALPNYNFEKIKRVLAGAYEQFILGLEEREKIHEKLVQDYLKTNF